MISIKVIDSIAYHKETVVGKLICPHCLKDCYTFFEPCQTVEEICMRVEP